MGKGDRTRRKIIQKVTTLFNQQGYRATSMQDITAATGIQRGGIYNHFSGKDEIALASFEYAKALLAKQLKRGIRRHRTAPEQLKAIASSFAVLYGSSSLFPCGCPVLHTAIEAKRDLPQLRLSARDAMDQLQQLIGDTVQTGVAQGELKEVDANAIAAVFVATLEGAMMLSLLYDDDRYLQQAVAHLHSYVDQCTLS